MTLEEMLKNDREKIDNVGLSINRAELEYHKYIITHKANVEYAYIKYGNKLINALNLEDDEDIYDDIDFRVRKHDDSKFNYYTEFCPYRVHFFPIKEEIDVCVEEDFNKAWCHHYSNNDHHPEYYCTYNGRCKEMPDAAIIEMALDWIAMSMNPSADKAYVYYERKKDSFNMHPESRKKFKLLLEVIKQYDEELGDV